HRMLAPCRAGGVMSEHEVGGSRPEGPCLPSVGWATAGIVARPGTGSPRASRGAMPWGYFPQGKPADAAHTSAMRVSRTEAATRNFFMGSSLFADQAAPGVSGVWYSSAKRRVNWRVNRYDRPGSSTGRFA